MKTDACFLCGWSCRVETPFNFFGEFYDCSSCGNYFLDARTKINFGDCDRERKVASHLAAELHLHNKPGFALAQTDDAAMNINYEVWPYFAMETFLKNYPKDSVEIIDRTLLNLAQLSDFPGKPFEIKQIQCNKKMLAERSIAFCTDWIDLVNLILFLEREGFVETDSKIRDSVTKQILTDSNRFSVVNQYNKIPLLILPKGLQRIRELKSKAAGDQAQAFIAMWFEPSRNKFYDVMEKAAIDAGFDKCLRIDNKETNNKICDEIIAEIRKSQCLIADFTGNRGGVYFEAGFALGLGIPVIWLVDDNWWNETDEHGKRINNLHFDTRQYAHINYSNEEELYERLKARIAATVQIKSKFAS